ncbi:MAG: DNA polymerase III subunit, partial [Chloroflexi bacterium]|nr:DNA polymerase III subunit [Chloroflexota bacterium]
MWRTRGHDGIVDLLKVSLAQGRVSHAYLITGPDHTGKGTLARELALALNCTAWQGEPQGSLFGGVGAAHTAEPGPCYECAACRKALAGSHPDLMLVEQWTTGERGIVDQIRGIQYASGLRPFEARWKVYVLLNAQDLTLAAQNALLKTLEEPAPTVCIILAAATPQALLPTVVSRCQQLQLRPPSSEAIALALEELTELAPAEAQNLAALAAGRIGWAIQAAEDPTLLLARQQALDQLRRILAAGTADRFRAAEALAAQAPEAVDDTLQLWLAWLRDVLLMVEGQGQRIVNRDQQEALDRAAEALDSRQVQRAIRAVQTARWQVDSSVNTRMAVEVLMLRLPALGVV